MVVCVSALCSLQMLEKTFYMENPDEVVPEKFVGCTINWAAGKDTTGVHSSISFSGTFGLLFGTKAAAR